MAVVVGMRPDNGSRVHPLFLPKDRRCIVQIYMCPAKSRADVDSYNIEQDPPRVKRQKSSSPYPKPTELDEPAIREEPWLNQLHIAARQGADDQQRHMVQPSPLQDEGKQRHGHRQMKVTAWEDGNAGIDSNEAGSTGSISNESYTKVNGSGDPIRSPPRKMLRIRSDGKLSSPKSCAVGEEEGVRRSRRSKGKVEPSWNGIVVIKYGKRKKTRLALGKKIEAILSAQRLSSDATEPSNGPKKPEEPPRPPHPFFTGQLHPAQESEMASKAKEKAKPSSKPVHPFFSNEPSKESRNSLCTPTTGPTNDRRDENSKVPKPPGPRELRVNSKPHGAGMSTKQPATFNLPPFGTDHARLMRVPGAREPMWPPHGMVHVGRECRQQISHGSSNTVTSDARKLKHIPVALSSQENVVKLTSEDRVGTAESLPTRHVMPGCKLQNAVLSRIFHSPSATAEDDKLDELSDQHIGEPSVPPYIQHLYLSIGRGRSAFDRFECESQDWVHKYAPKCAEDVLQQGPDAALIRDWLKSLTVSSVTVQPPDITSRKRRKIAKRKRRRQSDLDDFIEASDEDINDMIELGVCEDDELDDPFGLQRTVLQTGRPEQSKQGGRLGHAAVISGPHGCGKSAAVHAVAKELGFEIFEINAGARRSGRDIIDRVGDMAHNHLVQNDHRGEKDATVIEADENRHDEQLQEELTSGRQTTMGSFFKSKGYEKKKSPKKTKQPLQSAKPTHRSNEIKSQKQSLILLEEADVLFEEDKPFWTTIMELVEKSRRPIIMTCTDESLLPLENMLCYGIFRFTPPPKHVAVDSLVLIAANEGHLLERDAIECLYNAKRQDLRATIMELQYYCQLAIGDRKGGLDWMLLDPLPENVRDYPKTQLRVVSEGTYQRYLGWLGIDTSIDVRTGVIGSIGDIFQAAHNTWNLDTDDLIFDLASSSDTDRIGRGMSRREQLQAFEQFAEACSEADLLPCTELRDVKDDPLDHTKWKMPARFRANFVEGQRLLKGRLLEDLSGFTPSLALTLRALAIRTLHKDEAHLVQKVQNTIYQAIQSSPRKSTTIQPTQTEKLMDLAFNPLTSSTSGSQISSLDGPIATVATELAPYVRSIAASDVRLEEQRQQLSAALEQPGRAGGGKKRKTRASYAALEGGSKASTRRERWFPVEVNYRWVMRTGGVGWQDIVAAAAAEEEVVGGVEGREYDGKEDGEEGKGKVSGPSTQEYDSEDELMQ